MHLEVGNKVFGKFLHIQNNKFVKLKFVTKITKIKQLFHLHYPEKSLLFFCVSSR